jgi:16S rRNA (uracil1498-N3)-methyltransferase
MKQFILKSAPDRNGAVLLEGDDYHYLVRVRRLAEGEYFPARLPDGSETLIQIISINKSSLTGKCVEKDITQRHKDTKDNKGIRLGIEETPSGINLPPIILFQALPKGEKMDIIVRQAAEGGITEIVPFVSEFSIVKPKSGGGQKFSRWERIVKEARQQSGSAIATTIRRPLTMDGLFEYWGKLKEQNNASVGLLFHHQPLAQTSLHSYLNNIPELVALVIGPEGGFSGMEVSRFMENGFKPLTIGDTILRTETAALYAAAAIRVLLLERNLWELK